MSVLTCDQCGREFEKEAHRDVHPCPAKIGEKTARAIRSLFDPTQYHLDEYADGTRPEVVGEQGGDER
jgi:hypothetical protein